MSFRASSIAVFALLVPWVGWAAGPDSYSTGILLSDGQPGATTGLTFSFRTAGSPPEKVGEIEIELPTETTVNSGAFEKSCTVDGTGPKAGAVCSQKFRAARIGEGSMTVEMLGMHTVEGDAYRVEEGPDGANLVFFFGAGQVFGVGAQSIFGTITLDGSTPSKIRIHDIQKQLDLPFGATAELEKGSFSLSGPPDSPAFRNPHDGSIVDWMYETRLSWDGGGQTQNVRPTAAP